MNASMQLIATDSIGAGANMSVTAMGCMAHGLKGLMLQSCGQLIATHILSEWPDLCPFRDASGDSHACPQALEQNFGRLQLHFMASVRSCGSPGAA